MEINFTNNELNRYKNHFLLQNIGVEAQLKLKNSSVLIVGIGGLGCMTATLLAGAGVGKIGLMDPDRVILSNLDRQILYREQDIGRLKVDVTKDFLVNKNPFCSIVEIPQRLSKTNASNVIINYDIVVDGSDNFATRSIINEICVNRNKPYIFGAVSGFDGQVSTLSLNDGPCLNCIFPFVSSGAKENQTDERGLLSSLPALISSIQSTEVLKIITNIGTPLIGRLLIMNALDLSFHQLQVSKNPRCHVCGS